ncbi:hypothetical protein HanIR_Chr17g0899051 [Helianthus annuus]|nr:hypothetical protein HanIR_Chr17g0899051 [Helianthus annuus]
MDRLLAPNYNCFTLMSLDISFGSQYYWFVSLNWHLLYESYESYSYSLIRFV